MGWFSSGLSRRLTFLRSEMSSAAMWLAVVRVTVKRGKMKCELWSHKEGFLG